jgi:hypothetical protein
MVNMRVARPGEISKVQFHRTIQPPQLRNPEQGRKERTPWLFFRDLPAHFVDSTANDPIPTRILSGVGANSAAFGKSGRARGELTVLKPTESFGEMRAAAPSECPEEWLQKPRGGEFRVRETPCVQNGPTSEWRAAADEDDGVDGPCSPASMCHNVVVAERHNERNRPPCKLPRSAWISRRECFKFTVSTPSARLLLEGS